MNPRDVCSEFLRHGQAYDRHLYAVPVFFAFDTRWNRSHCRRNADDNRKACRKARESLSVLTQETRRLAKGVNALRNATDGLPVTIYQLAY